MPVFLPREDRGGPPSDPGVTFRGLLHHYAGRPAFLLGGGPSLKTAPVQILGEYQIPTMAVNMAFVYGGHAVVIGDPRVVELLQDAKGPMHDQWVGFQGAKILAGLVEFHALAPAVIAATQYFPAPRNRRWPAAGAAESVFCGNTGLAALSILDALGASTIYLVGFDMAPEMGNWHDAYPADWASHGPSLSVKMQNEFAAWAPHIRAKVVNCNPESHLREFPKREFIACANDAARQMCSLDTKGGRPW